MKKLSNLEFKKKFDSVAKTYEKIGETNELNESNRISG